MLIFVILVKNMFIIKNIEVSQKKEAEYYV